MLSWYWRFSKKMFKLVVTTAFDGFLLWASQLASKVPRWGMELPMLMVRNDLGDPSNGEAEAF